MNFMIQAQVIINFLNERCEYTTGYTVRVHTLSYLEIHHSGLQYINIYGTNRNCCIVGCWVGYWHQLNNLSCISYQIAPSQDSSLRVIFQQGVNFTNIL
jgi:hypothetical protein